MKDCCSLLVSLAHTYHSLRPFFRLPLVKVKFDAVFLFVCLFVALRFATVVDVLHVFEFVFVLA